ncbi:MAG TPA: DUF4433 domain-containing protein [Thermosulfidibacter takaii]|uniref:DUF4433 domain-containing protein n=1 Tax=Thermosulfidibacter takaii TaxID=412593 RepID=A0A7C0Y901_9BACT|nr:DUF4433 domain-containing protein [Thermosulfidibacter takaii]
MNRPPSKPKVYHITHVNNLSRIIERGALLSDARILKEGGPDQTIGMSKIKRRRLEKIEVTCHPGTKVGQYVPFYFCPRSVMLYLIYRGNHPELGYRGGQNPIIHLEADLYRVVEWADKNGVLWAFSLSNAGSFYVEFRAKLLYLQELDWLAIAARDFRDPDIKERKQAEFLVYDFFPFDLVERIGVRTKEIQAKVLRVLTNSRHKPLVEVCLDWYY